jgi:hypothetical protein
MVDRGVDVDVEDSETAVEGQSVCSALLQAGWTEDVNGEQAQSSAAAAAVQSSAAAAASASSVAAAQQRANED